MVEYVREKMFLMLNYKTHNYDENADNVLIYKCVLNLKAE